MIKFVDGDFFNFDADIRVNTVNCVGVMGAGVALAFKKKYPEMFKEYAKKCKAGLIQPGKPSVWHSGDMFSKSIEIINFPTKDHWRKPSEYEYIESGLIWLSEYLKQKNNVTLTLPALGCGHGGLDWSRVKKLIENYLGDSQNKILVFEPNSSKNAGKINSLSSGQIKELQSLNINVIGVSSDYYPERLKNYTEKDLYSFCDKNFKGKFDVSIVSSSKPSEIEQRLVNELIEYCKRSNFSILFGGSVADKNAAMRAINQGVDSGVLLPSGIFASVKNINKIEGGNSLTLLSIGNPFESFDRKSYMPSVLSRIYLSDFVVFTTGKLAWITKNSKSLQKANVKYFHIGYHELPQADVIAVEKLSSTPIEIVNEMVDLSIIQP
ncbi:MAG: hypothetical protein COA59_00295 [Colwellia sp.]|jgi:O-acetyl-ADP-ribose deacetylase (regulator of RNase III)|nr:MAG: hypothetical protein COA59_00295 [Colwellia sp.]